jgi:hypothetical protein
MDTSEYDNALRGYIISDDFAQLDDDTRQRAIDNARQGYLEQQPDADVNEVNAITERINKTYLRSSGRGRVIPKLIDVALPSNDPGYSKLSKEQKDDELAKFEAKIPSLAAENPTQREDQEFFLRQQLGELKRRNNGEGTWWATDKVKRLWQGVLSTAAESVGATDIAEGVRDFFHENTKYDDDFSAKLAEGVGSAAASVAVMMAATAATEGLGGTAAAAETAGVLASLGTNGIMRFNEAYKNAIDAGLDERVANEAGWSATPAAVIDALSDKILASEVLPKNANKLLASGTTAERKVILRQMFENAATKEKAMKWAEAAFSEGASEAVGDYTASALAYAKTGDDSHLQTQGEFAESFILGAVIGGGLSGAMDVPGLVGKRAEMDIQDQDNNIIKGRKFGNSDQARIAEIERNTALLHGDPGSIFQMLAEGRTREALQASRGLLDRERVEANPVEDADFEPEPAPEPAPVKAGTLPTGAPPVNPAAPLSTPDPVEENKKLQGWQAQWKLAETAASEGVDLSSLTREEYADYAIQNNLAIDDTQLRMMPSLRNHANMQDFQLARKAMIGYDPATNPEREKSAKDFDGFAIRVQNMAEGKGKTHNGQIAPGVEVHSGTATSNSWLYWKINQGADSSAAETHKSYLGFKDIFKSMTPKRVVGFMKALKAAGYNGDLKTVQDIANQGHISDQIVMHGKSEADAQLAAKVAQDFFGDEIGFAESGIDSATQSYSERLSDRIKGTIAGTNPVVAAKPTVQQNVAPSTTQGKPKSAAPTNPPRGKPKQSSAIAKAAGANATSALGDLDVEFDQAPTVTVPVPEQTTGKKGGKPKAKKVGRVTTSEAPNITEPTSIPNQADVDIKTEEGGTIPATVETDTVKGPVATGPGQLNPGEVSPELAEKLQNPDHVEKIDLIENYYRPGREIVENGQKSTVVSFEKLPDQTWKATLIGADGVEKEVSTPPPTLELGVAWNAAVEALNPTPAVEAAPVEEAPAAVEEIDQLTEAELEAGTAPAPPIKRTKEGWPIHPWNLYMSSVLKAFPKQARAIARMMDDIKQFNPNVEFVVVPAGTKKHFEGLYNKKHNIIAIHAENQTMEVIGHEVAHSLTDRAVGQYLSKSLGNYIGQVQALAKNTDVPHYVSGIAQLYLHTAEKMGYTKAIGKGLGSKDVEFLNSDEYAFSTINEFIAYAFASEPFQDKLAAIRVQGSDAWTVLSNFVKGIVTWMESVTKSKYIKRANSNNSLVAALTYSRALMSNATDENHNIITDFRGEVPPTESAPAEAPATPPVQAAPVAAIVSSPSTLSDQQKGDVERLSAAGKNATQIAKDLGMDAVDVMAYRQEAGIPPVNTPSSKAAGLSEDPRFTEWKAGYEAQVATPIDLPPAPAQRTRPTDPSLQARPDDDDPKLDKLIQYKYALERRFKMLEVAFPEEWEAITDAYGNARDTMAEEGFEEGSVRFWEVALSTLNMLVEEQGIDIDQAVPPPRDPRSAKPQRAPKVKKEKPTPKEVAKEEVLQEESQTETQAVFDDTLEESIPEEDKQIAAQELGHDSWTSEAAAEFRIHFAEWMVSFNAKTVQLTRIFSQLLQRASATAMSVLTAVSMAGMPALTPQTVVDYKNAIVAQAGNMVEAGKAFVVDIPEAVFRASAVASQTLDAFKTQAKDSVNTVAAVATEQLEQVTAPPAPPAPEPVLVKPSPPPTADFGKKKVSKNTRQLAQWVLNNRDNAGYPFAIVDKLTATISYFGVDGKMINSGSALLGLTKGVDFAPNPNKTLEELEGDTQNKVTTAGRYPTITQHSEEYGDVIRTNKKEHSAEAIHRVYTGEPSEKRQHRLDTKTVADNRISFGCINVDPSFVKGIADSFRQGGVVYVMPESVQGKEAFIGFEDLTTNADEDVSYLPAGLSASDQVAAVDGPIKWDVNGIGSTPSQADINYFGFTKVMTPAEFRSLVPAGNFDSATIEFTKQSVAGGEKIAPPFVTANWNEDAGWWEVFDHEGRSRTDAATELGATQLPVNMIPRGWHRARHITQEMRDAPIIPQNGGDPVTIGFHPEQIDAINTDYMSKATEATEEENQAKVDEAAELAGFDTTKAYYTTDGTKAAGSDQPIRLTTRETINHNIINDEVDVTKNKKFYLKRGLVMHPVSEESVLNADKDVDTSFYKSAPVDDISTALLSESGFEGVVSGEEVVVLDPSNIASGDPIERDTDDGVISLNDRFANDDDVSLMPVQQSNVDRFEMYYHFAQIVRGKLSNKIDTNTQRIIEVLKGIKISDVTKMDKNVQARFANIIRNVWHSRQSSIIDPETRFSSEDQIRQLKLMKSAIDAVRISQMISDYDGLIDWDAAKVDITDRESVQEAINKFAADNQTAEFIRKMNKSANAKARMQEIYQAWRDEYEVTRGLALERFKDSKNYLKEVLAEYGETDIRNSEQVETHFNYLMNLDTSTMEGKELYDHSYAIRNLLDGMFLGMRETSIKATAEQRNVTQNVQSFAGTFRDANVSKNGLLQFLDSMNRGAELIQVQLQRLADSKASRKFLQETLLGKFFHGVIKLANNEQLALEDEYVAYRDAVLGREVNAEDRIATAIAGRLSQWKKGESPDSRLRKSIANELKSYENLFNHSTETQQEHLRTKVKPVLDHIIADLDGYTGNDMMVHFMDTLAVRLGMGNVSDGKARLLMLQKQQEIFNRFTMDSRIISEGILGKTFEERSFYMPIHVLSSASKGAAQDWDIENSVLAMQHNENKTQLTTEASHYKEFKGVLGNTDSFSYNSEYTFTKGINQLTMDHHTIFERNILKQRLKEGTELHNIITMEKGVPRYERVKEIENLVAKVMANATSRGAPPNLGFRIARVFTKAYSQVVLSSPHHLVTQPLSAFIDHAMRNGDPKPWLEAASFYANNYTKVNAWFAQELRWIADRSILEASGLDPRRYPSDDILDKVKNTKEMKFLEKLYEGAGKAMTFGLHHGDNWSVKVTVLAEYLKLRQEKGYQERSFDDIDFSVTEGELLTQATLNAEQIVNTSNKILRGDWLSDRKPGITLARNILSAFGSHSMQLSTQFQQAIRDIHNIKATGGTQAAILPAIQTIAAITTQQLAFTTARFGMGALTGSLIVALIQNLYDDDEGTIEALQNEVFKARETKNKVKIAEAENELANAKTVRSVVNKLKQSTQSADSLFKQIIRDGTGSFHLAFNNGAMTNFIEMVPDKWMEAAAKQGRDDQLAVYDADIRKAKERKDLKQVARLTEARQLIADTEYIPLAYSTVGSLGITGIYGAVLDAYSRQIMDVNSSVMGVKEWSFNDFVLGAASLGIGQAEVTKALKQLDKIENEHWQTNKEFQENRLPAAIKKQKAGNRKLDF